MLTQERLKELLDYNPEVGIFTNIKHNRLTGSIHSKGYICIGVDGDVYLAHRLAWLFVHGEFPQDQIDHINQDKTDNSIDNLRAVNNQENHRNKPIQKNNTSGVIGVSWSSKRNMWRARIMVDRKDIPLGYHTEFHEAVNSRKNAEALYGFHENHGKA